MRQPAPDHERRAGLRDSAGTQRSVVYVSACADRVKADGGWDDGRGLAGTVPCI